MRGTGEVGIKVESLEAQLEGKALFHCGMCVCVYIVMLAVCKTHERSVEGALSRGRFL